MLGINSHALPVQRVQHMVLSVSARAKKSVAQSTRRTQRLTHVERKSTLSSGNYIHVFIYNFTCTIQGTDKLRLHWDATRVGRGYGVGPHVYTTFRGLTFFRTWVLQA